MASSATIGGINVTITATTEKFSKGVGKARQELKGFVATVKSTAMGLTGLGGLLSAGAFVRFTKQAYDSADALAKTSVRTGIAIDKLAGLEIAAEDAQVSFTTLTKAIGMLTLNTAKAANGDEQLASAFERVGLNAKKLLALSPDQRFKALATAIGRTKDSTVQLSSAQAVLGKSSQSVMGLLRDGGETMNQADKYAQEFGLTLTSLEADKIQAVDNAFDRLGLSAKGLFRQIASDGAGMVATITEGIVQLTKLVGLLSNSFKALGTTMASSGTSLLNTVERNVGGAGYIGKLEAFMASGKPALSAPAAPRAAAKVLGSSMPHIGLPNGPPSLAEQSARISQDPSIAMRRFAEAIAKVRLPHQKVADFGNNARDWFGKLGSGLAGAGGNLFGQIGHALTTNKAMKPQGYRGLSAYDPTSREGNAQRVAALGQGRGSVQDLAKRQLDEQKKIEMHLAKIAKGGMAFAPANLGG